VKTHRRLRSEAQAAITLSATIRAYLENLLPFPAIDSHGIGRFSNIPQIWTCLAFSSPRSTKERISPFPAAKYDQLSAFRDIGRITFTTNRNYFISHNFKRLQTNLSSR